MNLIDLYLTGFIGCAAWCYFGGRIHQYGPGAGFLACLLWPITFACELLDWIDWHSNP